jgi:5'/3'-nucleotidase SurE
MTHAPIDLATARVLLSNDDGIDADGLKLLEKIVRPLVREVWVVAPETEQSAASHSLTMRRPLYVRRVRGRRYTVDGTPTDCVLLAINQVMRKKPPDLVLSGVNRGGNLGEDATYSGTIAAAMEGTLLGVPSIAFSQRYTDGEAVRWDTAAAWIKPTLERLAAAGWPSSVLINVNFPAVAADQVTGIEVTRQGRHKVGGSMTAGVDPRGEGYFWIGGRRDQDHRRQGTDLEAVHRGAVSVTPLCLDLTHQPSLRTLQAIFS